MSPLLTCSLIPTAHEHMHWYPDASEWPYFIRGRARISVFTSNGAARTFIIPPNMAHYVENIGDEPIEMLEVFSTSIFQEFSLEQWLAQTLRTMVAQYLNLNGGNGKRFIDSLSKDKISVKPARRSSFSLGLGGCNIERMLTKQRPVATSAQFSNSM